MKIDNRYYRVCFRGRPRQYDLYTRFQKQCEEALSWLRSLGRREQAADLYAWMHGPGGFTRPHMPYYVTLSSREWDILSNALRQGREGRTPGYTMALAYGKWLQ